jgi:proteasome lid subunit RPN8/RPN11
MRISADLRQRMQTMGESAYPNEGCGILVGRTGDPGAEVLEVRLGTNLRQDRARDRYILDPRDILRAEKESRAAGLEVVGFWHTHPDHPARPSQYDADHAWPGYVYVIVSVERGRAVSDQGWVLETEAPPIFREEPLA